jgi:hypothetical protein
VQQANRTAAFYPADRNVLFEKHTMTKLAEEFHIALPRSETLDGGDLRIAGVSVDGEVLITDGVRTAGYVPIDGKPLAPDRLRIQPAYAEEGWTKVANCVPLSDGERTAFYVPASIYLE